MSNLAEDAATHPRTIAGVAIALGTLVSYTFARGVIGVADLFCRALFGTVSSTVSWIPWLGHKAVKGLDKVKARLINYLGYAAGRLDRGIANSFHGLAQVFEELGNEIAWQAAALAGLAYYVVKTVGAAAIGPKLRQNTKAVQDARAQLKKVQAQTTTVTKEVAHPHAGRIGAAIHTATRSVAVDVAGLRSWTIPRVRGLEREVEHGIPADIAGLRARTRGVEAKVETLWQKVRHLDKVTTGALASALVLTALGRLGVSWIRCSNWRKIGHGICRAPVNLIEDLLGLIADFVILTNICQVLPWLEEGFSLAAAPLIDGLTTVGAGICHGSIGPPATLAVPPTYRPANPGVGTLQLP